MLGVNRLRFLSVIVFCLALVLVGKLYFVQIVSGESYREKAEHQYVAPANFFDRGAIFFSTKDGELIPGATVQSGFILAIDARKLPKNDLEAVYEKLNSIVPLNHDEFIAQAFEADDSYIEAAKKLTPEVAKEIEALKIPGVSMVREKWRIYPGGEIAAHAIGLVGFQGNELSGRYGLERFYGDILNRAGDGAFVNFFAEIFSNVKKGITSEGLEGDIVTTLEPTVETFLEKEIDAVTAKYSSEFTGGIIINPENGEIYAMALSPSFDPNFPQNEKSSSVFRNKFVEDRYEMGSIIKPLTIAAGLDSGVITAKTTYNDPGCMTLNKKT
ncbi:MAG: penicillin-binding transpeptidase domain-containing protein, partial [Patescibacteria group bacterium]